MKYKNDDYRTRERHAHKGAVNLLGVAGWPIKDDPALLPPALREGLNAADANVVILASGGNYPFGLEAAVRETRVTVLIIEPGSTREGSSTYYFTLVRCIAGELCWSRALRLWVDWGGKPYLVPDLYGDDPRGESFALSERGIASVQPPYPDKTSYDLGVAHARAILPGA